MAGVGMELHNFTNKFIQLWNAGLNARLTVVRAGKATINFQLTPVTNHHLPLLVKCDLNHKD